MEAKKVDIGLKEQLLEAIEAFGWNIDEKVNPPASSHLLLVNEKSQKLDEEKSEIFHSIVANILYIMRRARPDFETEISLLFRWVSKSNVDSWKKLREFCLG